MDKQKIIAQVLDKQMDRKQFLGHIGGGILVLIGFSGLLKHLRDYGTEQNRHQPVDDSGYGDTAYGLDKND